MTQTIEYLIIGGIIFFQLYIFYIGRRKIAELDEFVPVKDELGIHNIPLKSGGEVSIIHSPKSGERFAEVYNSLNNYLKNNKGASADFSLMKDIVERNIQKIENSIELLIPLPLYCGLIGTMLGIIIGLFSIPAVSSEAFLDGNGIDILINGVKVAMIASATGLLLTTLNSAYFFRLAKANSEQKKHDFYTFIQTELMPILSEEVGANLTTLYQNLAKFNLNFSKNITRLDGLMDRNYEALLSQERVMDKLEKIDLTQLAKTNINLFNKIQNSSAALEKFNSYLQNVNSFVENSSQLNNRVHALLSRTEDVEKIANNLNINLEESKELQAFIKSHFHHLEERGELINKAVVKVEDQIDKSLNHLEEFIQNKMRAIKELAIQEEDLLKKELKQKKNLFADLPRLKEIKDELVKNRETQSTEFVAVGEKIVDAVNNIEIKSSSKNSRFRSFLTMIGFSPKEND